MTRLAQIRPAASAYGADRFYPVARLMSVVAKGLARVLGLPGLDEHDRIVRIAHQLRAEHHDDIPTRILTVAPLDSVRYFEFARCFERLRAAGPFGRALDVSSPRFLIVLALQQELVGWFDVLNPDASDLSLTRELLEQSGLADKCSFYPTLANELGAEQSGYDLITSLSVIEHIPGAGDREAIRSLWAKLKPGGRLLITVPCAATAFEEYTDFDPYGLYRPSDDGFFYAQRFYDTPLLADRVFSVTGQPAGSWYYGEKRRGWYFSKRRARVCTSGRYHFSLEPLRMATGFREYTRLEQLPGVGVGCFEFIR